jgi:hypothetical protein
VGMGAASFWRGAWYILDDHLFPNDAAQSAAASLGLGILGMAASQGLVARAERLAVKAAQSTSSSLMVPRSTLHRLTLPAARFGALYTVAVSCVLVWRGTWIGWDVLYERFHPAQQRSMTYTSSHPGEHEESHVTSHPTMMTIRSTDPGHATHSGLLSHLTALCLLLGTGLFASVLAPPAAVSVIRDIAVKTGQTMVTSIPPRWTSTATATATAKTTPSSSSLRALLSTRTQPAVAPPPARPPPTGAVRRSTVTHTSTATP